MQSRSVSFLCALALAGSPQLLSGHAAPATEDSLPFAHCFAPDTPQEVVDHYAARQSLGDLRHSLLELPATKHQFSDSNRWSSTATDGNGLDLGAATTLTWSIVPDGTSIYGYNGEPTSASNLRAFLNGIYGSEAAWLPIFQQVFDRWGELTGIHYVYEPNDDGSAWTQFSIAGGQLGVRGDVRIAGHPLDGNSGVLAYNFFPNAGDMVIDTADNFFTYTGSNSLGLRNTLAHEHGHGLGLAHVCPVNQTKLMEPFISFGFDGPQHDDVVAANRGYGDADEDNDSPGTSVFAGTLSDLLTLPSRSIDDNSDVDYYSFDVSAGSRVNVTLTPIGSTYLSGPQTAQCNSGATSDTLAVHDLAFRILSPDTTTVLADVDAGSVGETEALTSLILGAEGTYHVEVRGDATDAAQLYRLEIELAGVSTAIFSDSFESGASQAWASN